jgi:hypothetical protein
MNERSLLAHGRRMLVAVVAIAAMLALAQDGAGHVSAAGPAPDFNIYTTGKNFEACDSGAGGNIECTIHPGETFSIWVYLDKIGPTAFGNGYDTAHVRLDYSAGLTRINAPNEWAEDGSGTDVWWPDCFSVVETNLAGSWKTSCTTSGGPSNYYNAFGDPHLVTEFTCTGSGPQWISLVNDPTSGTRIIDQASTPHAETPSNTLVVNCAYQLVEGVTGDGFVTGLDFFGVLSAFGDCIPSAPGCNP